MKPELVIPLIDDNRDGNLKGIIEKNKKAKIKETKTVPEANDLDSLAAQEIISGTNLVFLFLINIF